MEKTRPRISKGATNRSTSYNRRHHRNTERTAEDLGGYIAVVDKVGIEELKQHQLKGILPEHIDKIHGTDYISVLFLCSSDFSIVVICKKELKDLIECEEI